MVKGGGAWKVKGRAGPGGWCGLWGGCCVVDGGGLCLYVLCCILTCGNG